MIIGVVGKIASGKSILSSELEKRGFKKLIFSDILREEMTKRGIELKRENFQNLADELRKENGADYLTIKLLKKVQPEENYIFEGIRNPAEIETMKKFGKCIVIGVEVPLSVRFQWIIMRNKENDPMSIDEARKIDDRENGKNEPEYGLQLDKCMDMVDFVVKNDGSRESFKKKINKLLDKLKL